MDTFQLDDNQKFPILSWKDEWEGEIKLESWKGFQNRNGPYGSIDSAEPSDGTSKIRVENESKTDKQGISQGQIAAINFLIENEAMVQAKIIEHLLPFYSQLRIDWGVEEEDWMPEISSAESFKQMIGLSWIHILEVEKNGVAYLGFELGCTWDDEHGLGIMLHKDSIIKMGGADVSFSQWIAKKDLEGNS